MQSELAKIIIVTLNLFQGPFLVSDRSVDGQRDGTVLPLNQLSVRVARWMLKQVQHDEDICAGVFA